MKIRAKEELNKKTSLIVDYDPIKSGRKTVGIRFYVDKKDVNGKEVEKEVKINKDEVLDDLIELMHGTFKIKEIREIAEAASYDFERHRRTYRFGHLNCFESG